MGSLDGRRALVTGASSGIGEATARALAEAGARVACLARRTDRVEALASAIGGVAVTADVTLDADARRGVDEAVAALGGLDVLVNNAGVSRPGRIADGSYDDWRTMVEVNVLGLLSVTQAALGHLREAGHADVVNVSSMAGRRVPGDTAGVYSATKHAVHAISTSLRRELAGTGVRVGVVSPGLIATGIGTDATDPALAERMARRQAEVAIDTGAVARAITRMVAEPPEVNTLEVAVLPTAQEM